MTIPPAPPARFTIIICERWNFVKREHCKEEKMRNKQEKKTKQKKKE